MYKPEIDLELYLRNINQYKWLLAVMFAVTALSLAVTGYSKEKVYASYSTLELGTETLIKPLIGEKAVSTSSQVIASRAEELVYSRTIMSELARRLGVVSGEIDTPAEEIALNRIEANVTLTESGQNYIQLMYEDTDRFAAKRGAEEILDLYLSEESQSRETGAGEAYDILSEQVQRLELELSAAEQLVKTYKNEKLDSGVTSEADINARLISMQTNLQDAELDFKEASIQYQTLSRQLESEARETVNVGTQSGIQKRIDSLELTLSELRTNYYDDYPDIVELKREIANQKTLLRREKANAQNSGSVDDRVYLNEAYQEMKLNRNEAKNRMNTMQVRVSELRKNIVKLQEKGKTVTDYDAKLAQLERDYDSKQRNYAAYKNDLEKARMTKSLATDDRQSDITIYEEPFLPVAPSGLRFIHYLFGGLILGILLPLGLIYLLQFFSQQIKAREMLTDMGIPVLGMMGKVKTQVDYRVERVDKLMRYVLIAGTLIVLTAMVIYKALGEGGL